MEQLLWNVSANAMMETVLTREYVFERHTDLRLTRAVEHEETTTSNLLRNLGYYGRDQNVRAAQHTKKLEGGINRKGRQVVVPSGADLELAIEVVPGRWLDLLLQAKALKPSGEYSSWKKAQNQKLIDWATAYGRVPGMLLYNDLVLPFVAKSPPKESDDFVSNAFGACRKADRAQLGRWGESRWCFGPKRTPAGVSLCLDQALMLIEPASPSSIRDFHFQLEHLLHVSEPGAPINSTGAKLLDITRATRPEWATALLEAPIAENQEPLDTGGDVEFLPVKPIEVAARASVVIPFFDTEEEA